MDQEYCPYCMSPVKPGEPCGTCRRTAGSYAPAVRHLPPGTVLQGRYLVGRVLGEGGFGITYIGRDLVLGLKVAVKEYFPADRATRNAGVSLEVSSYTGNSSFLYQRGQANFLREARTMARLDRQPNIVSVKDFFETNNTAYIVMEYIDGTTFHELVDQRGGRLPAWELLHMIEPMFDALGAMHELGLIHRDINPDNLMLERGVVRLLDFGCARESANGDASMTIMLRHGYAPLEQYQSSGGGQGSWTDVYALSATIYYCLTGTKPPQAMDRLLEDHLVPPRKLGVDLSARQEKALLKGLSIHPRPRFQSVEAFHTALYAGGRADDSKMRPPRADGPAIEEPKADIPRITEPAADRSMIDEPKMDRPKIDSRETAGPEKDSGRGDGRIAWAELKDKLLTWLKSNKKRAGVAALLAVVLLGAVIAGISISRGHGEDDLLPKREEDRVGDSWGNSGGSSESTELSGKTAYVYNWDLDQFEELMNDSSVSAIIIPIGHGLNIHRPMELTKPVRLEAGTQLHLNAESTLSSTLYIPQSSGLYNNDLLTVTGGGRIETDGYYGGDGLLRTVAGGSVQVGDTGRADFGTLWLERAGDLKADSSRISMDRNRYIAADEDALFENAVHVDSFAELEDAVSSRRTEAIVIDSSFEMESWLTVNIPVLISEDTVLTARQADSGVVFTDVAINRGRLEGALQFGDGGVCLNYGSADILLTGADGSCILNLGEFRFQGGLDRYSSIVNLGSMFLERGDEQEALNIVGGNLMNYGDIDLISGSLQIRASGYFGNRGTVRVSADADIGNTSHFWTGSDGLLILEGNLWNYDGLLDLERTENLDLRGGGIEGGMVLIPEDHFLLGGHEDVRSAALVAIREPAGVRADVASAWDLQTMESSSPQTLALRLTGDVAVEGDLTLTHDLIVDGTLEVTGRLTVDGGVLQNFGTLSAGGLEARGGACLRQDGGVLRLNGGTLSLYDSTGVICSEVDLDGGELALYNAKVCNMNTIRHIGGIRLDDEAHRGSYLYNRSEMELLEGAGVDVGGGVFTSNWMDVGGGVTVSGGSLDFVNGARFYNGAAVAVAGGDSQLSVCMNWLQMDGGTRIVNDGTLRFDGWEMGQFNLDGEIVNRSGGHISLQGEPTISGVLRNEGDVELHWGVMYIWGEFNNQGTAYTYNRDAGYQGNWTGRALEYR